MMKRIFLICIAILLFCSFGFAVGDEDLIKQSSKGEKVVRIQMRLFDLGFYTYKPTGSFQTVTRSAVVAFQVASGIMSDGTVGQESMEALFSRDAKRAEFHAEVPLTFTAQGAITQQGKAISWSAVKSSLIVGNSYRIRNASTGEDVTLLFDGGDGHAELVLPSTVQEQTQAVGMLNRWLGSTNSFYKCAVLLNLEGQWIAASLQWDGVSHACLYLSGSVSHVFGIPDAEHEANIRRISY